MPYSNKHLKLNFITNEGATSDEPHPYTAHNLPPVPDANPRPTCFQRPPPQMALTPPSILEGPALNNNVPTLHPQYPPLSYEG